MAEMSIAFQCDDGSGRIGTLKAAYKLPQLLYGCLRNVCGLQNKWRGRVNSIVFQERKLVKHLPCSRHMLGQIRQRS